MNNFRKPKIGWMVFANDAHIDPLMRDDQGMVYPLMGLAEKSARRLADAGYDLTRFEGTEGLIPGSLERETRVADFKRERIITDSSKTFKAVHFFNSREIDCVVIYLPNWIYAGYHIQALKQLRVPIVLWAPLVAEGAPICAGAVLHGALDEAGIDHRIVYSDICNDEEDLKALGELDTYFKAFMVKNILKNSVYGRLGGRAMGANPARVDFVDWMTIFGIDVEEIDQYNLILEAEKQEDTEVKEAYLKISSMVDNAPDLDQTFKKAIRLYLGYKKIIKEYKLDFASIKCLFELSDNYSTACLAQSLINMDGFVSCCLANDKGALVMYIMRLLTQNTAFQGDIISVDPVRKKLILIDDGTAAFNLAESKNEVCLRRQPKMEAAAGGICTKLVAKSGNVTLASLHTIKGRYLLHMTEGTVTKSSLDDIVNKCNCGWINWPHVFIDMKGDPWKFLQNIRIEYIIMCYGSLTEQLREICRIYDIDCIVS